MTAKKRTAFQEWADEHELNQELIAGGAGVSVPTAKGWLTGDGAPPRIDQVAALEARWPRLVRRLFPEAFKKSAA